MEKVTAQCVKGSLHKRSTNGSLAGEAGGEENQQHVVRRDPGNETTQASHSCHFATHGGLKMENRSEE